MRTLVRPGAPYLTPMGFVLLFVALAFTAGLAGLLGATADDARTTGDQAGAPDQQAQPEPQPSERPDVSAPASSPTPTPQAPADDELDDVPAGGDAGAALLAGGDTVAPTPTRTVGPTQTLGTTPTVSPTIPVVDTTPTPVPTPAPTSPPPTTVPAPSTSPRPPVIPAEATGLQLSHVGTATAGEATDLTLTVVDKFGDPAIGYTGTVSVTSTDRAATLPEPIVFVAADAGTVRLPGAVTHRTAAPQTLTIADSSGELTDSTEVLVDPGQVADLIVRGPGYAVISSDFLDPQVYIPTAYDAFGNRVTRQLDLTMSVSPGSARLVATGELPRPLTINRPGEISFPLVELRDAGPQRLKVHLSDDPGVFGSTDVVVFDRRPSELKVEDPYLTGETRLRVNPLAAWLTSMPGGTIAPLAQPTLDLGGTTYQLGELSAATDRRDLVWDLDPPDSTVATDSSHTLLRCDGATPCSVGGALIGAAAASYAYTFVDGTSVSATLDLEIVGEGRDIARPELNGEIPFTITPVGLEVNALYMPWNTSFSITSVTDKGLLSEVGLQIPQSSGGAISATLDLYSSAGLVTGSQLILEKPLEVVQGPPPNFQSVRILPPARLFETGETPQLTMFTGVMLNLSTDVLPTGERYTTTPSFWGLIAGDSPVAGNPFDLYLAVNQFDWPGASLFLGGENVLKLERIIDVPSGSCVPNMVIGQSPSPGTTIVQAPFQEETGVTGSQTPLTILRCVAP